jgi:hypothetical protein
MSICKLKNLINGGQINGVLARAKALDGNRPVELGIVSEVNDSHRPAA